MVFTFNVNKYTVRYLPSSQLHKFPQYIAYFLGQNNNEPQHDHWVWLEILVGSFCGILVLEGVFRSDTVFSNHHAPIIIASYGATAILCFNAKAAPLSQPRNIIFGHFFSSLIGVCIEKLFSLSQTGRDHYYIGAALSVAVASVLMAILNCVHPPAGASALLPLTDEAIRRMSWWYLPVQLVSSVLIVAVACITNNVISKYPAFWWYAGKKEVVAAPAEPVSSVNKDEDVEADGYNYVKVTAGKIHLPPDFPMDENDYEVLEIIQRRLNEPKEV